MFTTGIFTTHLPYIALVMFYAFFWLLGINKANSNEISIAEGETLAKIQKAEVNPESVMENTFDIQNYFDLHFIPPVQNKILTVVLQLKQKNSFQLQHWKYKYYASLFYRPPPSFI